MIRQPWNFDVDFVELSLPQNRVVRATIKVHDDASTGFNFDGTECLRKLAIDGLGLAQIAAVKLPCQPAIAAVRKHVSTVSRSTFKRISLDRQSR